MHTQSSMPVQKDLRHSYDPLVTLQAAALALEHGWSINLGGGMHHAYAEVGLDTQSPFSLL